MCGIFGYIGQKKAVPLVLEGLKRLEYRGYDSAGIATLSKGKLFFHKEAGKITNLEQALDNRSWEGSTAISHTRWATHGVPSDANAHPHLDVKKQCAVVHNGIIENHQKIRSFLQQEGVVFSSDTDTEVIAQLIGYYYENDLLKAIQKVLPQLQGAFSIACIHQDHPQNLVCAARESPLAIGVGREEMFVASDANAFLPYTNRALYLYASEVALITADSVQTFDENANPIIKKTEDLHFSMQEASKGKFTHYTLKEIYEQPQTINNALLSRYNQELGSASFENLHLSEKTLHNINRILIIACGTSYHAALLGAYMIEERAHIPVQVEISSEFRYKNPIVSPNTLAIAISQSGETADTLAAMRELQAKGAHILALCNVQGSTLARTADSTLFLRAGPEIAVASTKAFTAQVTTLALLTLFFARMRCMSQSEGKTFLSALLKLPDQIKAVLAQSDNICAIAQKYTAFDNFFYLGRRFMYPTALEGALKIKEIAYVNANGYPAGEMKHGPIALIDKTCPTIAFCSDGVTYHKMVSNLMEVKARDGKILAIAPEGSSQIEDIADDIIWVPPTIDELSSLPATVASQLFAYHFAVARGTEIDQPRNLAKSVTVE